MSNPKTKLDQIKNDARVHDILAKVVFRKNRYFDRITGERVSFRTQIRTWFPHISIPTIGQALRELLGAEPAKGPVGRPAKATSIGQATPTMPQAAPQQPASMPDTVEQPKAPQTALSRYGLVRKVDRRTRSVSWGYFDSKSWEQYEVICGSYRDTLTEIARLEELNETMIVGHFCNGKAIKINNGDQENEAEEPIENDEEQTGD